MSHFLHNYNNYDKAEHNDDKQGYDNSLTFSSKTGERTMTKNLPKFNQSAVSTVIGRHWLTTISSNHKSHGSCLKSHTL